MGREMPDSSLLRGILRSPDELNRARVIFFMGGEEKIREHLELLCRPRIAGEISKHRQKTGPGDWRTPVGRTYVPRGGKVCQIFPVCGGQRNKNIRRDNGERGDIAAV